MIISIVKRTSFHIAIQIKKCIPSSYHTTKRGEFETYVCDEKWVRISTDGRVL